MPRPLSRTVRVELVAVAAVLAVLTVVARATALDLAAADLFREPCCSWPMARQPFWKVVYEWGVLAGVLLAAAALVVLSLSYWHPRRLLGWRKPALYLVLVCTIGPGLVVNVAFKDHFGRPRPREVVELGGTERFLPVWTPGPDPQAKSFPCGHCSMGFYLSTPWLVLKRRRRKTGLAFLAAGLVAGGALGAARMMAGGHFLSDVAWAGGMVWLVAIALYHLLDMDREVDPALAAGAVRDPRKARLAALAGGGALGLLAVGVLLATPYVSSKRFARTAAQLAASPAAAWEVRLDEATVQAAPGPDLEAAYDVQAFGFPTSRVLWSFHEAPAGATLSLDRLGWFTERRTQVRLALPATGPRPLRLSLGKGRLALDLRGLSPDARLDVEVGEGEVEVTGADALDRGNVRVTVARGRVLRGPRGGEAR